MTNKPDPPEETTTHSASDSSKCYEMKRKYGWDLLRIDEHPTDPIFKVDCVFVGEARFPNYMENDDDD
ncbi:MAG: hypothetical protein WBB29_09070 [Geitlerinemataceae cyanobacterium]